MMDDDLHSKSEPRFQGGKLYSMLDMMGPVLSCDKCGAWQRIPHLTEADVREHAKACGWSIVDGADLCPPCSKAA